MSVSFEDVDTRITAQLPQLAETSQDVMSTVEAKRTIANRMNRIAAGLSELMPDLIAIQEELLSLTGRQAPTVEKLNEVSREIGETGRNSEQLTSAAGALGRVGEAVGSQNASYEQMSDVYRNWGANLMTLKDGIEDSARAMEATADNTVAMGQEINAAHEGVSSWLVIARS